MPWKWYELVEILSVTQQFQNLDVCTFHTNTSFIGVTIPTLLHSERYTISSTYTNVSFISTTLLIVLPWFQILFLLPNLFNIHKTCISKIKSASSFSYHWPCSCYMCQNTQVHSSLNSPSPSCSGFCFVQSQAMNFFASSKRRKVLISLQQTLMVYIIMYILPLFYCCTIIHIHTVIVLYT